LIRYFKNNFTINQCAKIGAFSLIQTYLKLYLTAFYAREWGNLIKQGLEMRQILEMMTTQKNQLLSRNRARFAKGYAVRARIS
jgi:competence protein ComGB